MSKFDDIDKDDLKQRYLSGSSVKELADVFDVNYTTVYLWLRRLGLKTSRPAYTRKYDDHDAWKDAARERSRKHREDNPDERLEIQKRYREKNKTQLREKGRGYNRGIKKETMDAYGGRCKHPGCNKNSVQHLDDLTIHHIHGNGVRHRKDIGVSAGSKFYQWLRKNGFPQNLGLEVRCKDHHTEGRFVKGHKHRRTP